MSKRAAAETTLVKPADAGGFEIFTDGRINAFFAYSKGDGYPRDVPNGHAIRGGGIDGAFAADDTTVNDPKGVPQPTKTQGTIDKMRISSGFLGNIFGFGMR